MPLVSHSAGARHELIARLPKNGIGAEIGVWKGSFSEELLKRASPRTLHLIDPWSFSACFPQRWYGGAKANDQNDMDEIFQRVVTRFAKTPEVRIHRMRSVDAAALFPDQHFDWVYIDGDHSFEAVLEDLKLWSAKVRTGGLMAGDDYQWRDEAGQLSVARAVKEFVAARAIAKPERLKGQFVIQL